MANVILAEGIGHLLSNDVIGQDFFVFIAEDDSLSNPLNVIHIQGVLLWVDHTVTCVIRLPTRHHRSPVDADDRSGGARQLVFGIGRIVVVRRNHPPTVVEFFNLKGDRLNTFHIEGIDLQRRCFGRVLEIFIKFLSNLAKFLDGFGPT